MSTDPLDDWTIVTATNAALGKAQVFRLRTEKPRGPFVASLLTAVTVTWSYGSESMFPVGWEKGAISEFERTVDSLSSENGLSELVQVSTGAGVKEWLYYVKDASEFVELLSQHLADAPQYPIVIKWYDDPG